MNSPETSRADAQAGQGTSAAQVTAQLTVDVSDIGGLRVTSLFVRVAGPDGEIVPADITAVAELCAELMDDVDTTKEVPALARLTERVSLLGFDVDQEIQLDDGRRVDIRVARPGSRVQTEIEVKRRRSRLKDADYQQIADLYRDAIAAGKPVQEAVAVGRQVSRSQAGSLIQEARRRGHLPSTTPGKKAATSPTDRDV